MTQLSLIPWSLATPSMRLLSAPSQRASAHVYYKGLQTISQIKNSSRCSNCGHRGRVELVIYFKNAVDVKLSESVGC